MRAWLITWEWTAHSAEVANRIGAILPPRWSPARVSDVLEQLYALHRCTSTELAACAKHPKSNPYRATSVDNYGDGLSCWAHPWLFARKVLDLYITTVTSGIETVSWHELDTYRMNSERTTLELASPGTDEAVTRIMHGSRSSQLKWDRSTQ
jgi:hypothetical protein